MRALPLTLLAALTLPIATIAQSPGTLLALSKHDHTLALVDPATLKVLARVPIGEDPHEVIASADGRTAWVSNYGFGALHTLAVVDLVHRTALPAIDLGPLAGPHGLTFVAGETWFTAEGAKALGRLDPATGKVDLVLGTGQNRTHMLWVAPDAQSLVTTNVSSGTVSLFTHDPLPAPPPPPPGSGAPRTGPPSPATPRLEWSQTVLKVGNGSEGFDVSPDGHEVWVANAEDGTISILDRDARSVVATLPADVPGANRLKFTPDGRRVLISSLRQGTVTVLDARTRQVLARIPIGHGAAGILIEPNGHRAFIACSPDNYIAVLDLATLQVTAHLDVGGEPDGLAWSTR